MRESTGEANRGAHGAAAADPRLDTPDPRGLYQVVATDSSASRGTPLELPGSVFDGRFRVEERVAEGGFAVVYKAWQLALERRVALKVLKPPRIQDAPGRAEFRERFAVEARTIARLRHPDIVDVYDFSVATLPSGELAPWMALEWLDGETLAAQLGRRRRSGARGRDPGEALDLLRPVLRALAHAHRQGIVHRDVKPSNIMVTETAHGAWLRVLDFGIAKIMVDTEAPNTGNTRTESTPAFSPAYAAPEQVAFSRTGPWTDVHALGLILAEVMTDEPPFSEADPDAHLFEQVMARRRPTPASKGKDVGAFEPVIARALALSPRDRWKNASELLEALEEAKAGRAVASVGAISAGAPEAAPIVEAADRRGGRSRARVLRAALFVVALGAAASAVVGTAWLLSRRSEPAAAVATEARPAPSVPGAPGTPGTPGLTTTPATVVLVREPTREREPEPAPMPEPSASAARGKERRRLRAATAPVKAVGDGRDLFNDTK